MQNCHLAVDADEEGCGWEHLSDENQEEKEGPTSKFISRDVVSGWKRRDEPQ